MKDKQARKAIQDIKDALREDCYVGGSMSLMMYVNKKHQEGATQDRLTGLVGSLNRRLKELETYLEIEHIQQPSRTFYKKKGKK